MKYIVSFVKGDIEFSSKPSEYKSFEELNDFIMRVAKGEVAFSMELNDFDTVVLTPDLIRGGWFYITKV